MSSDVDSIFQPIVLDNLREDTPPVQCIIWKGGDEFELLSFEVYPFDTVHVIKQMIFNAYHGDLSYLPRFTFVGVPVGEDAYSEDPPSETTTYVPMDYLWYPQNTNDPYSTYQLANPIQALEQGDLRFVSSDGSYSSPNYEVRGRSTLEDVFLKPRNGRMPIFHVYTLKTLLQEYTLPKPVSEEEWNKKFAPYFPDVKIKSNNGGSPYEPNDEDRDHANKIRFFVSQRTESLNQVNTLLSRVRDFPKLTLTGVRQLALTWKKPITGYEGPASTFYRIPVTEDRPFMRLLPAEGSAITKIHVKGVIPIPTLEDARILESWGKETTPTQGRDFCCVKYVQRPSIGIVQPIYGTIHILYDGTMKLLLQPPKTVPKMDPRTDFNRFRQRLEKVFEGMPQSYQNVSLKEISAIFSFKIPIQQARFNKQRLLQRLPFFQALFKEIPPLPGDESILNLRYKAVSQYASENKIFTFITQLTTNMTLEGERPDLSILTALQNEFELSRREAANYFSDWYRQRGSFTIQIPEEGEFIESFNPGIDIRIYAKHPLYSIQVTRIDNLSSYLRIYTLLSMLFLEDDRYFMMGKSTIDEEYEEVEEEVEQNNVAREVVLNEKQVFEEDQKHVEINPADFDIMNDPFLASEQDMSAYGVINDPFSNTMPAEAGTAAEASSKGSIKPMTDSSTAAMAASSTIAMDPLDVPSKGEMIVSEQAPPKTMKRVKKPVQEKVEAAPSSKKSGLLQNVEQKLVDPDSWLIKKLQEIDKRLFKFPAATKGDNAYSRKCASYDGRQPSVMTQDQYENMRLVYENDRIFWVVYPIDGTRDPVPPIGTEETIYVMRYGSDANNIHYYFCPEYYCLSCEIMVREVDFVSTVDRNGKPKPQNTCPFCKGKLISYAKVPMAGYTVIRRRKASSSLIHHKFIDFMKKTTHPENFALPCCFRKEHHIRLSDVEFDHIRDAMVPPQEPSMEEESKGMERVEVIEADEEPDYKDLVLNSENPVEYAKLFETIQKEYIMDSNAQLTPGKFAAIPPLFDTFFNQNSKEDLVTRITIKMKLRANAHGFLRIGTESTVYESLLGVIAPLLTKNTISEVKEMIEQLVRPRIFMNSHFGNLVLEFFNPADGSAMPPTRQDLMTFAQMELGISLTSANTYAVIRIYNAYKRFIRFIRDPAQRKDLRHIQPLLAEPELFTTRGLQLVIMEDNGKDPITIKCPIFGLSADRHKKNDIAFISRTMKTIGSTKNKYAHYELYLYTTNRPAKGAQGEVHENIIRWDYNSRRHWPEIVTIRINEYLQQCQSRYRSIYSSQQGVHPMATIPLSYAVKISPFTPEGIVKDSYNHIVGITFRTKAGSPAVVCVPVVDDGAISILSAVVFKSIYLDWSDVPAASVNEYVSFYKKLSNLFSLYPGYAIQYAVRQRLDQTIKGIQLKNGLYLPATAPNVPAQSEEQSLQELGLDLVQVDEMEWKMNRDLSAIKDVASKEDWDRTTQPMSQEDKCGSDPEMVHDSTKEDLEELYQVFRLMVSNWITNIKGGPEVRRIIEEIIFNEDLPEYERRKRLFIVLSPTMIAWFYQDNEHWERASTSFLRKDCRIIQTEEGCTGSCHWKQDEGKCLLHVPETANLSEQKGQREVNTAELFIKRVVDDLVRFPSRRLQLMKKGQISKVTTLTKPIRDGDQYIIPETSITWSNLLRFDWMKQTPEEPRYYEEMSRQADEEDVLLPEGELPDELRNLIGEETVLRLKMFYGEKYPIVKITGILEMSLEELGLERTSSTFTNDSLKEYIHMKQKPIGFIHLGEEHPIRFLKPIVGYHDDAIIIVQMGTNFGLLIEEDGNPTVQLQSMPSQLKEAWKQAGVVLPRKKVIKAPEEEKIAPPLLIGQPQVFAKQERVPLVVQSTAEEKSGPRIIRRVIKPVPPPIEMEESKEKPKTMKRIKPVAEEKPVALVPEVPLQEPSKTMKRIKPVAEEKPVVSVPEVPLQEPPKTMKRIKPVAEEKPVASIASSVVPLQEPPKTMKRIKPVAEEKKIE